MEQTIQERILDFHETGIPRYVQRDGTVPHVHDMATTLVGARKAGKTYRAYQAIQDAMDLGHIADIRQVCYLHFDDETLMDLDKSKLSLIDTVFLSLLPDSIGPDAPLLFVFDEIHKIDGWEHFVLRLIRNPNNQVLVTGSSADLEEDKVGRQLRGKTFTQRIFPLSFAEFLRFSSISFTPGKYSTAQAAVLKRQFEQYLETGSYPGVVTAPMELRRDILLNYFSSVVAADFIFENPVSNPHACKLYLRNLLQRNACPYRHKKERNALASMGHGVAARTISEWFHQAETSYLLEACTIHSDSTKKIEQNYRKLYAVDWALANAVSSPMDARYTRALESVVYWHLRRQGLQVTYDLVGPEKYEIDFLVAYPQQPPHQAIQVCYRLDSQNTIERETRGFTYLRKRYPGITCSIVTADSAPPTLDGIECHAAWRFCLDQQ